jgi:serine/threonine-protein kinase HipA
VTLAWLALEDFCSILDLPTEAKYGGTMERIARAVRPQSTAPEDDLLTILRHRRWRHASQDHGFAQGRRVWRREVSLGSNGTALKLNGNDDKLRRADFRTFAATAGLKAADTDATMDKLVEQMGQAIGNTGLPELAGYSLDEERMADQMFDIIRSRFAAFA